MDKVSMIEAEIRARTAGHTFIYPDRQIPAAARAWAEEAVRLGYDADWAVDWILRGGQPEPMPWLKHIPPVTAPPA